MANSIKYTGRVVVRKGETIPLIRTDGGLYILGPIVVAEDHQKKKGALRKDPRMKEVVEHERNEMKSDDDYITYATSWHRVEILGDQAEALAQDEEFGHGALIDVEASYTEDAKPWVDKGGTTRASRPESIGDKFGSIKVRFAPREPQAIWDGVSDLPSKRPGSSGGGGHREYSENEGF